MPKHQPLGAIAPEDIRAQASADGHHVVVTGDRVTITAEGVPRFDIAIEGVRRIQFDIVIGRRPS